MPRLAKRIHEGCEYPRWYGFAYRDWARNQAVCYPLGLNWLAGLLHEGHVRLAHGIFHRADRFSVALLMANVEGQSRGMEIERERFPSRLAAARSDGHHEGRTLGRREGWDAACTHMDEQITRPLEYQDVNLVAG